MIIRLADCPPQPWKNGLGSTREIAVHPSAADGHDFIWRISIAEVNSAAPFSRFPGIDRHIVLLEGAGFRMMLNGQQHDLTPLRPFAFAGEALVEISGIDGASRDFNLMSRRSEVRGRLQVESGPTVLTLNKDVALLHCARGQVVVGNETLMRGDSWRPAADTPSDITLGGDCVILVVCIEQAATCT